MMKALIIAYLVVVLSAPAFAQDSVPVTPDMIPIMTGEPAPFTGMLVVESRFINYVKLEIRVVELEGNLRIQKRLTTNLENLYSERLKVAAKEEWYQTPEFNRWLGFAIGVLVVCVTVWAESKLR